MQMGFSLPTLTIAVLTLNEEHHIVDCLRSAAFADELLVLDSGSRDCTVALARGLGAKVIVQADWQGFAAQRAHQLANASSDYLFLLDADERIPEGLRDEIEAVVRGNRVVTGLIRWEHVAFGRRLGRMRAGERVQRMFRRDQVLGFEGVVHEHAVLRQPVAPEHTFRTRLLHHSRETIHGSLVKLAQYAQLGAVKRSLLGKRGGLFRGALSGWANFLRYYVLEGGMWCGPQGFLYCLFIGLECFFRYVALRYDKDFLKQIPRRGE